MSKDPFLSFSLLTIPSTNNSNTSPISTSLSLPLSPSFLTSPQAPHLQASSPSLSLSASVLRETSSRTSSAQTMIRLPIRCKPPIWSLTCIALSLQETLPLVTSFSCAKERFFRATSPSTALHEFEASIELSGEGPVPLGPSSLLLRGIILRNTEYIYGIAVYTGFDTKVALNMRNPPSKMSSVERKLNWVVLMLFIALATLVITGAIVAGVLQDRDGAGQWYMGENALKSGGKVTSQSLGTFLILFSTFIPVSLFVTFEFIRVLQALFMSADFRMRTGRQKVLARATNLNEMLGEVEHVLSDKTGTLTENIMRYIACSAGAHVVPEPKDETQSDNSSTDSGRKKSKKRTNPALGDKTAVLDGNSSEEALPEYQGQSPDEVALVTSAREYGITLMTRTLDTLVIDRFGTKETYTTLAELEFNSDCKRMGMILWCPDGKIKTFTKGADTIMLKLINKDANIELIQNHIDEFAKEGLRILVFAMKELEEKDFQTWFERFQEAQNSLEDREGKNSKISAELEEGLMYVATTAVEDKLQHKVPETIKFLREAGIKLWVLTGDKRETAENIGYSANLLDRNMEVVHIAGSSSAEVQRQLNDTLDRHVLDAQTPQRRTSFSAIADLPQVGVIIDGASLHHAIEDHSDVFMALSDHTKVAICCRLTPLQKALVVRLVREKRKAMILAIGDGESMLDQE
ncbi:unnamed protein product [Chondrus crispus]|uniref:Phospholipid-transporting ATPase n=1 Tax=Chondrus crispus TaxID=2769 RepID=R7QIW6_CHOCR|nr:unnamed protein product [Chondrus crispus]CDF37994.1 unnamed protein product [Chondrus crispus]|eukprot:XP_005717863.1 unnamed protein product [Chondrus crispus]